VKRRDLKEAKAGYVNFKNNDDVKARMEAEATTPANDDAVAQLQRRLGEKEAEIEVVRKELESMRIAAAAAATPPAEDAVVDVTPSSDVRKQLADVTAKWRREERRARAREEELLKTIDQESKRADGLQNDLEASKQQLKDAQEKIRDASRKRAASDNKATNVQIELDKAKLANDELVARVAQLTSELAATTTAAAAASQELEGALARARDDADDQRVALETARAQAAAREEALERQVAAQRSAAAAMEDKLAASKSASRQTGQIVKDLKAELLKAQRSPASSPGAGAPDRLTRDLADRLESLLKDNATLREKIKYLEEIVQSLTAELKGR